MDLTTQWPWSGRPMGACAARHFQLEWTDGIGVRVVPLPWGDCPITCEAMVLPVMTCDGHVYEQDAIRRWLSENDTSPVTGLELATADTVPVASIQMAMEHFLRNRPEAQWLEKHEDLLVSDVERLQAELDRTRQQLEESQTRAAELQSRLDEYESAQNQHLVAMPSQRLNAAVLREMQARRQHTDEVLNELHLATDEAANISEAIKRAESVLGQRYQQGYRSSTSTLSTPSSCSAFGDGQSMNEAAMACGNLTGPAQMGEVGRWNADDHGQRGNTAVLSVASGFGVNASPVVRRSFTVAPRSNKNTNCREDACVRRRENKNREIGTSSISHGFHPRSRVSHVQRSDFEMLPNVTEMTSAFKVGRLKRWQP